MSAAEVSELGQKSIEHTADLLVSTSREEEKLRRELSALRPTASRSERDRIEIRALDTYDQYKAATLFVRFGRNRTWQCPTLIDVRVTTFAELSQLAGDSRLHYVPLLVRQNWSDAFTNGILAMGELDMRRRRFQNRIEMTGAMLRAGVGILAGTDSHAPFNYPGFSLHEELELLVRAGLSPVQALQSATLNAARFLGKEAEFGTVEKGESADLVLLDANPLENISNTQRIHAVVLNGKFLPSDALHKLLGNAESAARSYKPHL